MGTVLSHDAITRSLFRYWAEEFAGEAPTIYPGMKTETSTLGEWVEIGIDSWARRPLRSGSVPIVDVTVVLHCLVKAGANPGRIDELTDRVRQTFSQQTIPLLDFDQSDLPTVGAIRLREPETRNLTRQQTGAVQVVLHHTVVILRGFAQATAVPV